MPDQPQAKEAPQNPAPAVAPAKGGNARKLALVALIVIAAGGAGGAGAWWAMGRNNAEPAAPAKQARKASNKPVFTTLEPFTVNLQDPRGERFAQIGVTLQFDDPATETLLKDRLPAVRNDILMLISSKQIDELISMEGKQKLARQIREGAAKSLGAGDGENPVREVLFSQFILQ